MEIIKVTDASYEYAEISGDEQQENKDKKEKQTAENDVAAKAVNGLQNINLSVKEGEFVAIVGHNGSGKSTLAKLLNGLLVPDEGKVEVFGFDTSNSKDVFEVRKRVGMVFQNPDSQVIFNNVYDDICFTLKNFQIPKQEWDKRINDALVAVGMEEFKNGEIFELSAGQKQIACLARAIVNRPVVVLADEPCAHLDIDNAQHLMDLLGNVSLTGVSVIVASHIELYPNTAACRPIMLNG